MTNKKDMIKLDGKTYKKEAFIIEDSHPAIGRTLEVEGVKFKILDGYVPGGHKAGTFITKLTEDDEARMEEYDEELDSLSEKLMSKLDIKRLIKENIKNKPHQDIKTGLFILKQEEEGKKIEKEHAKGCYQFSMHYRNQTFDLISGSDVMVENL